MSAAAALTSPLPYAIVGTVVLVLAWRHLPRWLRCVGATFVALLVATMTPVGAHVLAQTLVRQIPPVSTCKAPWPKTIVLLSGGGDDSARSAADYATESLPSLRRTFAAVALWRRTPGAHLVIAGGGRHVPESELLASLAEQLGVPAAAITTETRSLTTWENARNVAALTPALPKRVWVVTSTLHMPRSLLTFRAFGFAPCAWPAHSRGELSRLSLDAFIPQARGLQTSEYALHELAGGLDYRWRAWRLRRAAAAAHTR